MTLTIVIAIASPLLVVLPLGWWLRSKFAELDQSIARAIKAQVRECWGTPVPLSERLLGEVTGQHKLLP